MVDAENGTHILGSKFGRLVTTYRGDVGDSYPHETIGKFKYLDNWLHVLVDDEICRYYASMIEKRFGIKLHWKSMWGGHVSVVRGEDLLVNQDKWGHDENKEVLIKYSHDIYTNGYHWWLNVQCDEISEIRKFYGLPGEERHLHLTVGRV
jgi:hypothetical protein